MALTGSCACGVLRGCKGWRLALLLRGATYDWLAVVRHTGGVIVVSCTVELYASFSVAEVCECNMRPT